MILHLLFNKLKSFFLVVINLFRRALCCFRRRRTSACDIVPLTHVVSNSESEAQAWDDWGDGVPREPRTVQDHIEIYRKRKAQVVAEAQEAEEETERLNFFEDMTPNITKQTKLYVKPHSEAEANDRGMDRLNFFEDSVQAIPSAELREWEETSGWEGENLETDAQRVLREKKRQERERRTWEHHQRRLERTNRSLGSKLTA